MAKGMLGGSRVSGNRYYRDEVNADGGARHLRHSNRYREERLWRSEAIEDLTETEEEIAP